MIPGLILAAGLSTRMGRSKALLATPAGSTFVARIASALLEGGVADVFVVGRPGDQALRDEVDRIGGRVRFIENLRADEGQLSSLIAGLNAADRPGAGAVLVTPVDLPLVKPETVATLIAAFSSARQPIVRPTHRGRHGHPVIFGRLVFDALRKADPNIGARAVVRSFGVLDVQVDDEGVLQDIDTPEDYEGLS